MSIKATMLFGVYLLLCSGNAYSAAASALSYDPLQLDPSRKQGLQVQVTRPDSRPANNAVSTQQATSYQRLLRWPAGLNRDWQEMEGGNRAYYRDGFIAIEYAATASPDDGDTNGNGEYWEARLELPTEDGSAQTQAVEWQRITYYRDLNGDQSCFLAPGWTQAICGSKTLLCDGLVAVSMRPHRYLDHEAVPGLGRASAQPGGARPCVHDAA